MIIDLARFLQQEKPYWTELEALLVAADISADRRLNLEEIKRLHYLYQRAATDLGKVQTFSSEPDLTKYLEALVSRAYGLVHARPSEKRKPIRQWFTETFPRTFRKHIRAFMLSVSITLLGALFGAGALLADPQAKQIVIGFDHLKGSPSERVAKEERRDEYALDGAKSSFSAQLMTHNTRVSITTLALGMTYGIGTLIVLFYNGVILGAVGADYIAAGESVFLFAWLLPHGSVEIPAILIAGQAGFVLASALIGWGTRTPMAARLRESGRDIVTLILAVGILLIWAGLVEAFLSQHHEPVIPYSAKILFGVVELILLGSFLARAGAKKAPAP